MKKVIIILFMVMFISILLIACQKEGGPERKKEAQAQKGEVRQQVSEKRQGGQTEQESVAPEAKEGKTIETKPTTLTEEEQRFVEKIGTGALVTPNVFTSEKEALKYLKILLKGDHKIIRFFNGYKERARSEYGIAIGSALSVINTKTNKEGFNLAVEVLKTKREYPEAIAAAAEALGRSEDKSVILLLKNVAKNPDGNVRLKAGKALLLLGDIETALPVLDELTKEGKTAALGYIFHNMQDKAWEQRGIDLIRKALSYENKESKALAALFLIGLTKKGAIKEDTKRLEYILINISEEILAKKKWPISSYGYSDHRALETVILAFEELKSKKAIPILKQIAEHPEVSYLKEDAEKAIGDLTEGNGGVKNER